MDPNVFARASRDPRCKAEDSVLSALILYDSSETGRAALQTLSRLAPLAEGDLSLRPILWHFEFLHDPDWRAMAMKESAAVDLVVIAASPAEVIPIWVQSWLETYLSRRFGESFAVVGLSDSFSNSSASKLDQFECIRELARGSGIAFFAPAGNGRDASVPCPGPTSPVTQGDSQRESRRAPGPSSVTFAHPLPSRILDGESVHSSAILKAMIQPERSGDLEDNDRLPAPQPSPQRRN